MQTRRRSSSTLRASIPSLQCSQYWLMCRPKEAHTPAVGPFDCKILPSFTHSRQCTPPCCQQHAILNAEVVWSMAQYVEMLWSLIVFNVVIHRHTMTMNWMLQLRWNDVKGHILRPRVWLDMGLKVLQKHTSTPFYVYSMVNHLSS
jgi:hypothetical protein